MSSDSLYFSLEDPLRLATLSQTDAAAYLSRISLHPGLLSEAPSLGLLAKLHLAHLLAVPFDTSSLHLSGEWDSNEPIQLASGPGMQLGEKNFKRIVEGNGGGFCFSLNSVFASLLRTFGFNVSECPGRVYKGPKDPYNQGGWSWTGLGHQVNLVDWPGSEERYLVDVGFGGGCCCIPIPLKPNATAPSDLPYESFLLRYEDLPQDKDNEARDLTKGWTVYRHVADPARDIDFLLPIYHLTATTMHPSDQVALNYHQENNPAATFASWFLVTIARAGTRRTLAYGEGMKNEKGQAKLWSKAGALAQEEDVEWIDFTPAAIGSVLQKEFGRRLDL